MMYEPRVLIGTPIYDKKEYALETQLRHVRKIDYSNYEQVFFDNSKSDKFYYKLKEKGLKVVRVPRGRNSREAVANSMNRMFMYALDNGYDYCLVLENDLYPDPKIIKRLLSHNKSVVASYYFIGTDKGEARLQELIKQVKQHEITKEQFSNETKGLFYKTPCIFVKDIKKESNFIGTRRLTRREGVSMFRTGLRKVHGAGLGATLIKRGVMMRFKFYTDSRFKSKHPDVYFYADLEDAKVPVYLDTSIVVPHQPTDWHSVKDR